MDNDYAICRECAEYRPKDFGGEGLCAKDGKKVRGTDTCADFPMYNKPACYACHHRVSLLAEGFLKGGCGLGNECDETTGCWEWCPRLAGAV